LRTTAPSVGILVILGALAAWGHSTDWTLPKFSALMGGSGSASGKCQPGEDGWCKEHNVPEAECIECNAQLFPAIQDYGWCKEHGIGQCPLEHPDVAQLKTVPTITAQEIERANRALALVPRAENNSHCRHYQRRIQFASQEAIDKAGIDIAVVGQQPVIEAI